jgi:hypothetical protein
MSKNAFSIWKETAKKIYLLLGSSAVKDGLDISFTLQGLE